MLLRKTKLWILLIKISAPEGRGKEWQLRLAPVRIILTDTRGRTGERRSSISRFPTVRWIFHQRFVKKQEARNLASSLPPFFPRPPYPVAFFSIFSSCRRILLLREIRRHRFKRTLRALLCQRPNRKSQLLRAYPSVRTLSLSSVSLGVFFNCAQCADVAAPYCYLLSRQASL